MKHQNYIYLLNTSYGDDVTFDLQLLTVVSIHITVTDADNNDLLLACW